MPVTRDHDLLPFNVFYRRRGTEALVTSCWCCYCITLLVTSLSPWGNQHSRYIHCIACTKVGRSCGPERSPFALTVTTDYRLSSTCKKNIATICQGLAFFLCFNMLWNTTLAVTFHAALPVWKYSVKGLALIRQRQSGSIFTYCSNIIDQFSAGIYLPFPFTHEEARAVVHLKGFL